MGSVETAVELPEWAATPAGVRARARQGLFNGNTSGMAPGYGQGNLVILPRKWANDFYGYCQANPTPCPLIGMTEPGSSVVPMLGNDVDLRTDLPRYRVWENGVLVDEIDDVSALWQDDFVGFVLGCSLSFEYALEQAGLRVRHVDPSEKSCRCIAHRFKPKRSAHFMGLWLYRCAPIRPSKRKRPTRSAANCRERTGHQYIWAIQH